MSPCSTSGTSARSSLRRRGRTILTLLGLALGVGLVIAISSLSQGLDEAQSATLDPLAGIGTDLTVTRTAPGGIGRALRRRRRARRRRGEPGRDHRPLEARQGRHALRARLLPAGHAADVPAERRRTRSRRSTASPRSPPGLMLQAVHQEGKVPKIVAKIKTGGDRIDVNRAITPPTAAEQAKIAGLPREARHQAPAPSGAEQRTPGRAAAGSADRVAIGRRNRERVREVPARAHAALPRDDHDPARDAAAGPRPAADRHQERVVHDRRRPARRSRPSASSRPPR